MQRKVNLKFHKKILCILILFVMIYSMFSFIPQLINKTYAATYTYKKSSNDLPSNFDKNYPGYKSLLQKFAKAHPNWTFKLYETDLEWETVINSEYQGHGSSPKNVVPKSYSNAWVCSICGRESQDTGAWVCASRGAIEHTMDPRNSLNDANIFQYLLLSNDKNITKAQVKTMASEISYLNSQTIIDAIYDAAQELNINPFYIIGKILQEQGSNGSVMCAGKGYDVDNDGKKEYVGYYNLFNVGASGKGEATVIKNGLKYAADKGWNTPKKSIIGGIGLIKSYITRGQDTLYYQKFNVTYSPYYVNQYAQNLFDSQSIASTLKSAYKDANLLDGSFTFEIPLYKNMPSSAVKSPTVTSVSGEQAYVNANGGLALRASPAGDRITYVSEGTQIVITKRATEKSSDGYYYDQVYTPVGTGYMARGAKDGSKTYLVVIKQYDIKDSNIIVAPDATIKTITGGKNTSKVFGTGAKISLDGKTYNLVMLGDVNGDGKISPADYVKVKNKITGASSMNAITEKAADVNRDDKISPADYVKIKNQITKASKITI